MQNIIKDDPSNIIKKYHKEFEQLKFVHNNFGVLVLALYLVPEQLFYAFFVREDGSFIQNIHLSTAIVMVFYCAISIYFRIYEPINISWTYKVYITSFGVFGFCISLARALLIKNNVFSLPTIYIAVIYGFAVIFCFRPIVNFCMYSITMILIIVLLPMYQPTVTQFNYIQDIISNNIIALILALLCYKRFVNEFVDKIIIRENNKILKEKALEIQKMNVKLKRLSTIDELTNMYNRRKLDEHLEQELDRAKRYDTSFSVILLDIDLFKNINDTYGHNIGDKVLMDFGKILIDNIRKSDVVGRWGGEEFLIICPETNIEEAVCAAEKLRNIIENNKFEVDDTITSSFGVATYIKGDSIYELISRADKGLYKAKGNGRNRVKVNK